MINLHCHLPIWDCQFEIQSAIGNRKSAMLLLGSFPCAFARVQGSSGVALTQLTTRTALQLRLFVGAESGAAVDWQDAFDFGVGSRDDMHANQFANPARGSGAGISRGFHRTHVSTHKDGDVTRTYVFFAEQLHVCRFNHGVSGFDGANKTFSLDHSECFQGHLRQSSLFQDCRS
jgi:hypothetical protein